MAVSCLHHLGDAPQEKEGPNADGNESKAFGIVEGEIQELVDGFPEGPFPSFSNVECEDVMDGVVDLDGFRRLSQESEAAAAV